MSEWIMLLLYLSGIGTGITLGGLFADWSFARYPEYWIEELQRKVKKKRKYS